MVKTLTKNARWIILWVEYVSKDEMPRQTPRSAIFNIDRHSYEQPTFLAIAEYLDFSRDKVLRSQVYEIDVAIFPYSKQWREASKLASKYFADRGLCPYDQYIPTG